MKMDINIDPADIKKVKNATNNSTHINDSIDRI